MIVVTQYLQLYARTLVATLFIGLVACGGGGSSSGERSFSDPANAEGESKDGQVILDIILTHAGSGEESSTVNTLEPLTVAVIMKDGNRKPLDGKIISAVTSIGTLEPDAGNVRTSENGEVELTLSVTTAQPNSAGTISVTYLEETYDTFFDVGKAPVRIGSLT